MLSLCVALALSKPSLLDFSFEQWKATPEMRIQDAYKWLYHATLGGEHAITNEAGPRAWLDREWEAIGDPLPGEPEIVPLTPGGELIRVNLRRYKEGGGDKARLLSAFVSSAREFRAERTRFMQVWQELRVRLSAAPIGTLTLAEWRKLDLQMRALGYPAISHSAEYERAYQPAYRVILASYSPLR